MKNDLKHYQFNALDSLYDNDTIIPYQDEKPLDTIYRCFHLLPKTDPLYREIITTTTTTTTVKVKKKKKDYVLAMDLIRDSFVKHQEKLGPFDLLVRCYNKQVIVYIRNINGIRGTLNGTLIGFDHHMNLLLKDVEERFIVDNYVHVSRGTKPYEKPLWIRKLSKKHKNQFFYYNTKTKQSIWTKPEQIKFKRIKRPEKQKRFLSQLFVKGDSVLMVSSLNSKNA